MLSVVIPVYRSEANLERLLAELERMAGICDMPLEAIFVVDGSPDRSFDILRQRLPDAAFASRLSSLSRNFGAFSAVRCGLGLASGDYVTVLPADLQEPPELALEFLDVLRTGKADIACGTRATRNDPWLDKFTSRVFWNAYRRFVLPELPPGGIHAFGCTRAVRDRLIELREPTTNLIALLFWLGYRRVYVPYDRQARQHGRSAWTLARKLRYGFDSVFSFTDLPIRLLLSVGLVGTVTALVFGLGLVTARLTGRIEVPGYTAVALVVTFFGSITSLGMGILGQYLWLVLRTTRGRPDYLVDYSERFEGRGPRPAGA
jgi:glycosyltransferase involved in cell wall biosynthesis